MERHRLKTVMILILALLNAFLIVHLVRVRSMSAAAERLSREQLTALFHMGGVALDPAVFSSGTLPPGCTLERDEALGDNLADFFLSAGTAERREEDGTREWTDGAVTVRLTAGGAFTVTGLEGFDLARCRKFCRQFGYRPPPKETEESCQVNALYNRLDICNCFAVFTFEGGAWRTASGTLLPRRTVPLPRDVSLLSASAAMSAFLTYHMENRVVLSTIIGLKQCYVLESGETAALKPAWRVLTDTVDYYVNGIDGTVFGL